MLGPVMGPMCGGTIAQYAGGWRSTFFVGVSMAAIVCVLVLFIMPETLDKRGKKKLNNPIRALIVLFSPPILACALVSGILFALINCSVFILSLAFSREPYSMSDSLIGLCLAPLSFGSYGGRSVCWRKDV